MTNTPEQFSSLHGAKPQPVPWLWPGRIAAGRLMLIDGDPGAGKSLLALDIAARLTSVRALPDGYQPSEPAAVLLLQAEDDLHDTVLPRLVAAGANLQRVYTWDAAAGPPVLPQACPQLEKIIQQTQARLVLFDPFFAFLGHDISSLNDLMIRRALAPLAQVAAATQAAFMLNRHLGKLSVGKEACYRGLGSMAILGAMRTAFLLARDPDDSALRVLACTKNNLAAFPPALAFRLAATSAGVPRIDWQGAVDRTADDLVAAGRRRGEAVPRGVTFLQQHLAHGPCNRQTLLEEAQRQGISLRTLERA
jgi:RecA-family ATPase